MLRREGLLAEDDRERQLKQFLELWEVDLVEQELRLDVLGEDVDERFELVRHFLLPDQYLVLFVLGVPGL